MGGQISQISMPIRRRLGLDAIYGEVASKFSLGDRAPPRPRPGSAMLRSSRRYSVVNQDRNLTVWCDDDSEWLVSPVSVGAVLVEVPCHCKLLDANKAVLVAAVEPCDPRLPQQVQLQVQLPALWAAPAFQALLGFNVTTSEPREKVIDHDWFHKVTQAGAYVEARRILKLGGGGVVGRLSITFISGGRGWLSFPFNTLTTIHIRKIERVLHNQARLPGKQVWGDNSSCNLKTFYLSKSNLVVA